jgi:sulfite exporter TauE/SafE
MVSKIFKIISIISAVALIIYNLYSWNDQTSHSTLISQLLLLSTFFFGGLEYVVSKKKSSKINGIVFLGIAIIIGFVLYIKF